MKTRNKRRIFFLLTILFISAVTAAAGIAMRRAFTDIRQKEVENILYFYSENIRLQMHGSLNEADALAQTALVMGPGSTEWFEEVTAPLLARDEVRYVCLIEEDTVVSALPADQYGSWVGHSLNEFSYVYTLAKVVKDLVVEGPVAMESDGGSQGAFLFLRPFLDGNTYLGEVVVALDCDYVLEKLGLDNLTNQGYDYELWRMDQQSGNKEVIAISGEEIDFSHAAKTSFYLPSQWNLSIQPIHGWINPVYRIGMDLITAFLFLLMSALAFFLFRYSDQRRTLRQMAEIDGQTGLYSREGFIAALDRWIGDGYPVVMFYYAFEGYDHISQQIGPDKEKVFLQSIPARLNDYINSPYIAGRLGAGHFILAVREEMDEREQKDFARGLSLELLLKIQVNGEKGFLIARYSYDVCGHDRGAADQVDTLVHAYYTRLSEESPVRMMAEKCRQLIGGQSDVVFDEYTDPDMMELSKTFNQYRKQVEQLAYSDPMFGVGNRSKYLRDIKMLISYDKKRKFSLFCVDICAFSQYNELFSADVGDAILRDVLSRLSRSFGTYLYRMNGDVFLGVSLTEESSESYASRIQKLLCAPVVAGSASLTLKTRIVVCSYPAHGDRPEELLDRIQSALRFAKASRKNIVIYNGKLNEMIRTEADILRRLEDGIQRETLEVWYQPIVCLATGQFSAAEALVRLSDGRNGYYSAGRVVALAERSGIVEKLGDYVLARACKFMRESGTELGLEEIGINVSVQQLLVENSAKQLLHIIRESGVDPKKIILEITESILIQSIEQASATLDELRRTGIRIALDDFGVGYSSLNYLSNLPVDVIKIDRSLTTQILTNPKQLALLKSIVEVADINSLHVVAEGVETEEEQKIISATGLHYIQGFYYAKPMAEEPLIRFLCGEE